MVWDLEVTWKSPDQPSIPADRFLKTVLTIPASILQGYSHSFELEWRRLQSHEQQSERVKKTMIQKAMLFSKRANEKQKEERLITNCQLIITIKIFITIKK